MTVAGISGTAPITGIFSRFDTSLAELIRSLRRSHTTMPTAGTNMAKQRSGDNEQDSGNRELRFPERRPASSVAQDRHAGRGLEFHAEAFPLFGHAAKDPFDVIDLGPRHLRADRTAAHGVGLVAFLLDFLFEGSQLPGGDLHLAFQAADLLLQGDALGVADHVRETVLPVPRVVPSSRRNSALVRAKPAGGFVPGAAALLWSLFDSRPASRSGFADRGTWDCC